MSRPPLSVGSCGRIHARVEKTDDKGRSGSHRAQAKYRDYDGRTRPISAFGKTKAAAETNLLKMLQERSKRVAPANSPRCTGSRRPSF